MNSIQLISPQTLLPASLAATKRRLTLELDQSEKIIYISNSFTPPISWFLTNESGDLVKMGQIEDESYAINFSNLVPGNYSLRIAGEVHRLNF